jgi:hypothetical protein
MNCVNSKLIKSSHFSKKQFHLNLLAWQDGKKIFRYTLYVDPQSSGDRYILEAHGVGPFHNKTPAVAKDSRESVMGVPVTIVLGQDDVDRIEAVPPNPPENLSDYDFVIYDKKQ